MTREKWPGMLRITGLKADRARETEKCSLRGREKRTEIERERGRETIFLCWYKRF